MVDNERIYWELAFVQHAQPILGANVPDTSS